MIGKARLGAGFAGLLAYLLHGPDGQQSERVAWRTVRNLVTEDERFLPAILQASAAQNPRVEKPVYHLSISFEPEEPIERQLMEKVVDRTLHDLGLDGHQAVLVAHNDTDHPHVHVMVNRVHPDTLERWSNSHDFARIERSLRHQERELGLREVPGRHVILRGQARYRDVGPSSGERREQQKTAGPALVDEVRAVTRPVLRSARSWQELHDQLAERGLFLQRRGRGLVISTGERRVKVSRIDRRSSRGHLEKRLGPFKDPTPEHRSLAAKRWPHVHQSRRSLRDLAQALESKVGNLPDKALRTTRRHLARSLRRGIQRIGVRTAAEVLPVRPLRLVTRVLEIGTFAAPQLKVALLAIKATRALISSLQPKGKDLER